MACPQSLELLTQIRDTLLMHHNLLHGRTPTYQGQEGDWSKKQTGKTYFYNQLVTFAGSTMNIGLNIPFAFQLNRTSMVFNDATSKDVELRVYDDAGVSSYASLLNLTGNTGVSIVDQRGDEYRYEANAKIEIHLANFTVGKTLRLKIQVNEL